MSCIQARSTSSRCRYALYACSLPAPGDKEWSRVFFLSSLYLTIDLAVVCVFRWMLQHNTGAPAARLCYGTALNEAERPAVTQGIGIRIVFIVLGRRTRYLGWKTRFSQRGTNLACFQSQPCTKGVKLLFFYRWANFTR